MLFDLRSSAALHLAVISWETTWKSQLLSQRVEHLGTYKQYMHSLELLGQRIGSVMSEETVPPEPVGDHATEASIW